MTRKPTPSLAILTCLLVWTIITQVQSAFSWGHTSYQMTDWLTNYAGGFVRRGLPGAVIGMLSDLTGLPANHLAIWFSLICYLLLIGWFLKSSTRTFPAILILSCIVMGFPAYQDTIIRKDCLGLLLLLGCIKATDARVPRPTAMVLVNVIAAVAILCHEAFVFYALPALVVFSRVDARSTTLRDLFRRSLALLPAVAVFLLTARYHGTPELATAVHESWLPLWRDIEPAAREMAPGASIRALGWSSGEGLYLSWFMLTSGFYQPAAWTLVFMVSLLLVVRFTARDEEADATSRTATRVRITALLAAQLVFISPLFLLGVDWGRWLFFWVASAMMLHTLGRRAPTWLEVGIAGLFRRAQLGIIFERLPAKDWYLLFFGVPVCWSLQAFMMANPVLRHLEIIRNWF